MTVYREAISQEDYNIGLMLVKEYASQIGIDLGFQNFNDEIQDLSKQYARPQGIFILASEEEDVFGCFGIRKLEPGICELKRMFIRDQYRGKGLGREMLLLSFHLAKELGYSKMRLDTLDTMIPAVNLYTASGFYEIPAYCFNPIPGARYFERVL
jgi:GNAT superfamily N-acetyltransferase